MRASETRCGVPWRGSWWWTELGSPCVSFGRLTHRSHRQNAVGIAIRAGIVGDFTALEANRARDRALRFVSPMRAHHDGAARGMQVCKGGAEPLLAFGVKARGGPIE